MTREQREREDLHVVVRREKKSDESIVGMITSGMGEEGEGERDRMIIPPSESALLCTLIQSIVYVQSNLFESHHFHQQSLNV